MRGHGGAAAFAAALLAASLSPAVAQRVSSQVRPVTRRGLPRRPAGAAWTLSPAAGAASAPRPRPRTSLDPSFAHLPPTAVQFVEMSHDADAAGPDPLWLRYPLVSGGQLAGYRLLLGTSAAVLCTTGAPCGDTISQSQLKAAAAELQTGLHGLLGTAFTATVTSKAPAAGTRLVASVLAAGAASAALGKEGFRIRQDTSAKTVHIEAATPSGLLYGTFNLLSLVQQHEAIPRDYESAPAMELRVWDLWDNADGSIEQVNFVFK